MLKYQRKFIYYYYFSFYAFRRVVPGAGGNKLQARLNKDIVPHYWCYKHSDYFDLWLDATELVPGITIDCWVIKNTF